jgi:hypothetical protein
MRDMAMSRQLVDSILLILIEAVSRPWLRNLFLKLDEGNRRWNFPFRRCVTSTASGIRTGLVWLSHRRGIWGGLSSGS